MLSGRPRIHFYFQYAGTGLKNRRKLKSFVADIFKTEKIALISLNIIFCSDKNLLAINNEFLAHNYYTDIITFNLGEGQGIEGEIYISLDRVKENARTLHQKSMVELHRVIFHGVLHLCGYKDKTPKETSMMRRLETKYLNLYFR